jgi:CRISPR-associated protein Cmr3
LEFNNKLLYPLPADCLIEEVNKSKQGRRITTFTSKGISSFPCDLILRTDDKEYETGQNNYTNSSELGMYLKNEKATFGLSTLPFLCNEPKVGIAIDFHSRTAKDSMLYRVDMKRPAGIDFIVGFEGIELAEKGLIRLGGEGKAVSYETITDERNIYLSQIEDEFVMYLSSPSVFENGWIPSFIDVVNMMGDIAPGLTVKLASAIVNRPLMIGGFDMDKNEAKPMLKAVPAGSVYFFDIIKGDPGILQDMQGKSVSDKRAKEGFGLVYFGKTRKEIEK